MNQDEYLNTLLQNSNGNVNRSIVDIKGLWGVEQNDNPFFYMLSSIEMNFDEYIFTVEAVFERRDFKKARRSDFFNDLKEKFVLVKRNVDKIENKRIKLIMVLRQAVMTC